MIRASMVVNVVPVEVLQNGQRIQGNRRHLPVPACRHFQPGARTQQSAEIRRTAGVQLMEVGGNARGHGEGCGIQRIHALPNHPGWSLTPRKSRMLSRAASGAAAMLSNHSM